MNFLSQYFTPSEITYRILLISDMHYSTEDRLGYTQKQRLDFMRDCILREHAERPIDALILPGDLSIQDYPWRQLECDFSEKLMREYVDPLPFPSFVLPGNHDSYPDELWKKLIGQPRQQAVVLNGCLFLLLDTFHGIAQGASGAPYTGVDTVWARTQMETYPDLPVFLVAHYFKPEAESEEFFALVRHPRVVCLIMGHTHQADAYRAGSACANKLIVDTGAFSYITRPTEGKWDFNVFHKRWAWGYNLLDFTADTAYIYHRFPEFHYHGVNMDYHMEEHIEDFCRLSLQPELD